MESDVSRERAFDRSQQIMTAFIAEYKNSPELWDPRDVNYSNKFRRTMAQDRLLPILRGLQKDATRIDVRKKINTIRSNYNKKAGMVRAARAEGRLYVPTSWMYHELRFLDGAKKPNTQATSNENESEEEGERIEEYADEDTNAVNQIKFEVAYPDAINYIEIGDNQETFKEVENNGGTEPVEKKPKFTRHIFIDGTTSTANQHRSIKPKLQIRRFEAEPEQMNSSASNTALEPIGLVWSSKLRTLRPTQRLFAEKAINDILFEASLNNLQKGPMVINVGMSSVADTEPGVQEEYIEYLSADEGDVS